ncbi:MAG: DUF87 domain-containing protein [Chloroflexi bacterium]|nr:DUF87 domain-containing protein [Chloroflexota bacterium]
MAIEVAPGSFYLGREVDPGTGKPLADKPVFYRASHLTTHAVCVGMTGSGKTGLCIDLLEEAVLSGVPSIIIDPKGDMGNLLLTFPDLLPQDFRPWINVDDAQRAGLSEDEFAAKTAQTWAKGLADWDQDGERIRRLKESAEFIIYTPGSRSGVPVNVLQSFHAPKLSWDTEEEALREQIASNVSALLGLIGIEADPIRSREHILLSNILENAWRAGQDVDMLRLIAMIQEPPFRQLGVLDIDTFFPAKDRFALAMALNSVVAAPSFQTWMQGTPLDIGQIIRSPQGKPRVSIFYISHLSDQERMFFVSLLLEQVIAWMRQQSGTTSLRAIVYFDEIFGFMPPEKEPSSKRPLLTLMKTARAFGVGIMLATQNPIDLDYKGLTNAGTWFVGKLQTTYDRQRLLDGMQGVTASAGTLLDRKYLDATISALPGRTFVLHNVNNPAPILMGTRWAMSYLRGPLTRSQIQTLMQAANAAGTAPSAQAQPVSSAAHSGPAIPAGYASMRPQVDAKITQYFIPPEVPAGEAMNSVKPSLVAGTRILGAWLTFEPYLIGMASVAFADATRSQVQSQRTGCLFPLPERNSVIDWPSTLVTELAPDDLSTAYDGKAIYGMLPAGMAQSAPYTQLRNAFTSYISQERGLELLVNETLKLKSLPGEDRAAFEARCAQVATEKGQTEWQKASASWKTKIERLEEQIQRKQDMAEKVNVELKGRRAEERLGGLGSAVRTIQLDRILTGKGFSLGRALTSAGGAAATVSRRRRMTSKTQVDLDNRLQEIQALENKLEETEQAAEDAMQAIQDKWTDAADDITSGSMKVLKSDISIEAFGLAWVPSWLVPIGDEKGVQRYERVNAAVLD